MIPRILRNYTAFVDGRGYAGRVDELTTPKLTIKGEEWRGGGMDAPAVIDMGLEKLEASYTFKEFDPNLFSLFGLVDGRAASVVLRGALQPDQGDAVPCVLTCRGMWKEMDMGAWKAGDPGSLKVTHALRYYKLAIDGTDLIEIDVDNMKRVIRGNDVLASVRAALGI